MSKKRDANRLASQAQPKVIYHTKSICGQCALIQRTGFLEIPATVEERKGQIVLSRECRQHGKQEVLVCSDAQFYYQIAAFTGRFHTSFSHTNVYPKTNFFPPINPLIELSKEQRNHVSIQLEDRPTGDAKLRSQVYSRGHEDNKHKSHSHGHGHERSDQAEAVIQRLSDLADYEPDPSPLVSHVDSVPDPHARELEKQAQADAAREQRREQR